MLEFNFKTVLVSANKRLYKKNFSLQSGYRSALYGLIYEIKSQLHKQPKVEFGKKIEVEVEVYRPKIYQGDTDNFLKIILDSLTQAGAIPDDRYIMKITIQKFESTNHSTKLLVKNM